MPPWPRKIMAVVVGVGDGDHSRQKSHQAPICDPPQVRLSRAWHKKPSDFSDDNIGAPEVGCLARRKECGT
jgi:hypothetical protein